MIKRAQVRSLPPQGEAAPQKLLTLGGGTFGKAVPRGTPRVLDTGAGDIGGIPGTPEAPPPKTFGPFRKE